MATCKHCGKFFTTQQGKKLHMSRFCEKADRAPAPTPTPPAEGTPDEWIKEHGERRCAVVELEAGKKLSELTKDEFDMFFDRLSREKGHRW